MSGRRFCRRIRCRHARPTIAGAARGHPRRRARALRRARLRRHDGRRHPRARRRQHGQPLPPLRVEGGHRRRAAGGGARGLPGRRAARARPPRPRRGRGARGRAVPRGLGGGEPRRGGAAAVVAAARRAPRGRRAGVGRERGLLRRAAGLAGDARAGRRGAAVPADLVLPLWLGPSQAYLRRLLGGEVETPPEVAAAELAEAAWRALAPTGEDGARRRPTRTGGIANRGDSCRSEPCGTTPDSPAAPLRSARRAWRARRPASGCGR